MVSLFVKICGLKTAESVDRAVAEGADALGFVFAEGSPRTVTAHEARPLVARVPDTVETFGVFRGQAIEEVLEIASQSGVTSIQFHGGESVDEVDRAEAEGFHTVRAFGVDEFRALTGQERDAWATRRILIDAVEPGSGVTFDPALLDTLRPKGWWMLAGGLTPGNVAELATQLQPEGVDVSSGVERARGVKSPELIAAFIRAARGAAVVA